MNKKNGEYEYLSSMHATPPEARTFLDITPPTSTAAVFGHVVVKGGLGGLLPGRIVSDEVAKGIDPLGIASHISHDGRSWVAVEYDREWPDVMVAVALHDHNGNSVINGAYGLYAKGELPVRWERIVEVDFDGY